MGLHLRCRPYRALVLKTEADRFRNQRPESQQVSSGQKVILVFCSTVIMPRRELKKNPQTKEPGHRADPVSHSVVPQVCELGWLVAAAACVCLLPEICTSGLWEPQPRRGKYHGKSGFGRLRESARKSARQRSPQECHSAFPVVLLVPYRSQPAVQVPLLAAFVMPEL